jgi:hypothetical protein
LAWAGRELRRHGLADENKAEEIAMKVWEALPDPGPGGSGGLLRRYFTREKEAQTHCLDPRTLDRFLQGVAWRLMANELLADDRRRLRQTQYAEAKVEREAPRGDPLSLLLADLLVDLPADERHTLERLMAVPLSGARVPFFFFFFVDTCSLSYEKGVTR